MQCNRCNCIIDEEDDRWVLSDDVIAYFRRSENEPREVLFGDSKIIGFYCCKKHALEEAEQCLHKHHAKVKLSDVRVKETCSKCGIKFSSEDSYRVLMLARERGEVPIMETLDIKYAARFCQNCLSTQGDF